MKLICAPMATLSHPGFRIITEKFGGCDEYDPVPADVPLRRGISC